MSEIEDIPEEMMPGEDIPAQHNLGGGDDEPEEVELQSPSLLDISDEAVIEVSPVSGLYEDYFLDYASYVILERAIPAALDGLKPVQRRILHAMREIEDGRFNKVANVIGQTMQYHPHGDAAIGDALVNLGQKNLLFETQGNWGDTSTGDNAAAPRYIEARLSKLALEIAFNNQTTEWQISYDGRKREPVALPMKFPLLLAQGVEGIAVGLSTKVLPHNFIELIEASINLLRNKPVIIYPDFPSGGMVDVANYKGGMRGGKVRIRARIEELDKKTLVIRDIPYGTTTTSVMESIVKASEVGKIKIKKVVDNTAQNVEIQVLLQPGTSPDITVDALYAFTDCEVSVSPNACVIWDDKPRFVDVSELLALSNESTLNLLKRELEIRLGELEEKWHFGSLEKIFIENRIYRDIEEVETWPGVLKAIDLGLDPFKSLLRREVNQDDIIRLTEIRIKRISKFDSFKADEALNDIVEEMESVAHNLAHLVPYAIAYFNGLLKKYGKGRERKTEIRTFDIINTSSVAAANAKLYVNRETGFIGIGLKKDEVVGDCSTIDDIITIRRDGKCIVTRVADKTFVGKDIIHVAVWKKGDERMVYNLVYTDGESAIARAKRFSIIAVTRDREYDLTSGTPNSKVQYLSANPNAEGEVVIINLSQASKAKVKTFDYDLGKLDVKGRGSGGNIVTKHSLRKVSLKAKGASTAGRRDIYFDQVMGRLYAERRGQYLGAFDNGDNVLVLYKDGTYELTDFALTNKYPSESVLSLSRYSPQTIVSTVYVDEVNKAVYAKRFNIPTITINKRFSYLPEGGRLLASTATRGAQVLLKLGTKRKSTGESILDLGENIELRGLKALGTKLPFSEVVEAQLILPAIKETDSEPQIDNQVESENEDLGNATQVALFEPDGQEGETREDERPSPTEGSGLPLANQLGLFGG